MEEEHHFAQLEVGEQLEQERLQLSYIHTLEVLPIASRPSMLDRMDVNCLRPGQVYTLPETGQMSEQISPRTRKRGEKFHLPPQQEYMRLPLARALVKSPPSRRAGIRAKVLDKLDKMSQEVSSVIG